MAHMLSSRHIPPAWSVYTQGWLGVRSRTDEEPRLAYEELLEAARGYEELLELTRSH